MIVGAAAVGGGFWLAKKQSGGSQQVQPLTLTPRQYVYRLAILLEQALSYDHKPMWYALSDECRRVGREDLPGHVREKHPVLAERFDAGL
jgi:hypothetical protein